MVKAMLMGAMVVLMMNPTGILAQRGPENQDREMRIEMMKKRFLQDRLELTEEEEKDFWPAYEAHEQQMKQLREEFDQGGNPMFLGDEEAELYLDNMIKFQEATLAERKQFLGNLREILLVRKVLFLVHLEDQFKKEVLKELRQRMDQRRPPGQKNQQK